MTLEGEETANASGSTSAESPDEVPHARGPQVLGIEDLGLQDGKGVEMDLVEHGVDDMVTGDGAADAHPSTTEEPRADGESVYPDKDGDIVLEDTTPKEEESTAETMTAAPPTGEETPESAGEATQPDSEKKE